ncbi:hypothetical protein DFR52_102405 [Hoeflea marina]|uniref:Uncharacterized protein n=1 Tax=Hoeflea marina TaxID=274592 RepID=A0A317PNA9_9HYPH|nr:hypothetical protein [Hoeflea marina]PWW01741.1 hypothetical protein DFR52_102405 [Hoeflea marina]
MNHLPDSSDQKQHWRNQRAVIRELLWDEWDPIGINIIDCAMDEYDAYADQATAMMRNGASVEETARYLTDIARHHIGMPKFLHAVSLAVAIKIKRIIQD